ncbi:replication initiation factor domain-containing protein [Acinetobacter puyangensis]|uniref:replication initiation factor domain-containing protein n=1 Tax=Acinetobacter puyangensis TaxID=1096779 RepID=UPI003A4D8C0F
MDINDLPFDNTSLKTKKEFNQHLTKQSKKYQKLNPLPTYSLWGNLYEMICPFSNTGQKSGYVQAYESTYGEFYKDYPLQETIMINTDSGVKPQLIRRPANSEICVPDFLHLTIHKNTFKEVQKFKYNDVELSPNSDYVYAFEVVLKDILGIGVECKLQNGKNYYDECYKLENDCGLICIGGQNETILLVLNGLGCTTAKYGWEGDLYAWLMMFAERPKITRIDLAHDDLEGEFISPDWALNQAKLGGFTSGGRPPKFHTAGQWLFPDDTGRTAYVGKRESGKQLCLYEKGKQLGDKDSNWNRAEMRYYASNYHIPLDILISPTKYFIAAYPCFHAFDFKKMPEKLKVIQRKAEITIDKAIKVTKHQFSKYLKFFRDYYGDDTQVLDMLMPDPSKSEQYPKRIKPILLDYSQSMPPSALPA